MTCRALFIPDDVQWLALVAGALLPLIYPYNFEPFGTATPAETAAEFQTMFDLFSFNQGVCRVIGEIITLAGSTNPNPGNWLPCDGASLLRASYPDLFAAIGVVYGSADGAHFTLPDLRGRVSLGTGTGAGLSAYALGDTHLSHPKRQRIATLIQDILTARLWQHLTLLPLALALLNQPQYRELGLLVLAVQASLLLAETALIIISNLLSR
jgi:hypothetical protein